MLKEILEIYNEYGITKEIIKFINYAANSSFLYTKRFNFFYFFLFIVFIATIKEWLDMCKKKN